MLARIVKQRPRSEASVRRYAAMMEAGEWRVTSDAVAIDVKGNVINGQHRLAAVVLAGKAVPFVILYGTDPDAFDVMDNGKRRSAADTLAVMGFPNATTTGYICRVLANYIDAGCALRPSTPKLAQENHRVRLVAEAYPDVRDSAHFARTLTDGLSGIASASMFGFLHFLATRAGHGAAFERFATCIATGLNIEPNTGAHRLRDRLVSVALSKQKITEAEALALTVKAFRADLASRPVKQLWFRASGDVTEAFPQMPDSPKL